MTQEQFIDYLRLGIVNCDEDDIERIEYLKELLREEERKLQYDLNQ